MLKRLSKANSRDLIRRTLLQFHVSRYQQLTKYKGKRRRGRRRDEQERERKREREEDMYTSLSIFFRYYHP